MTLVAQVNGLYVDVGDAVAAVQDAIKSLAVIARLAFWTAVQRAQV